MAASSVGPVDGTWRRILEEEDEDTPHTEDDIRLHNGTLKLEKGDMVEISRGQHSHWAIYIGDKKVVHLKGRDGGKMSAHAESKFSIGGQEFDQASVCKDYIHEVAEKGETKKNNYLDNRRKPRSGETIVEEALIMIGEIEYNVLWNNCERFASFCRYGVAINGQECPIDKGKKTMAVFFSASSRLHFDHSNDEQ